MTDINTLLELKNKLKEVKPEFIRQDYPKRKKLSIKWRKPKGIHSKIRHKFKGRRKMPSPGYKSPKIVRGLHSSGLRMVNVSSVGDIIKIKKEKEGAVILKSVGMKKRLEILTKSKELNITVLNLNVDEQIKKISDILNSKKKKEAKKGEVKEVKVANASSQKESASENLHSEEKKEAKKEKDKVLTKRI